MLHDLAAQESSVPLARRLRLSTNPTLLVADEISCLSYGVRYADLLFEAVSRRYQQRPIILMRNKVFSEWGKVFPNASCVVKLVDRPVHRAEIVTLDGPSYRLMEAEERAAAKAKSRSRMAGS